MRFSPQFKRYIASVIASSLFVFSTQSFASGFQLWEESAASLGDYHAGGAAEANDASSIFYNPAGMARMKRQQISAGLAFVDLNLNYTGSVTLNGSDFGPYPNNSPGGTFDVVPNFHYVLPINNKWAFGLEETTPFGLATNYTDPMTVSSVGMLATNTKLQTININPSLSYAINDKLSLGAGFDVMYGSAIYDDAIQYLGPLTTSMSGYGYGYNAGALYQFSPTTRAGVSYRSGITIDAKGPSETTSVITNGQLNSTANANFPLPPTTMMSLYHDINQRWAVMGSAFYTQWSVFKQLVISNMATPMGVGVVAVNENYRNTWNFSVGSRYRFSRLWSVEAGVGHDETPTQIPYRDIRLPDADRYAASLGINYHPINTLDCSFGWTHFFMATVPINNSGSNDASQTTPGVAPAIGIGNVKGSVNVFGLQVTWTI